MAQDRFGEGGSVTFDQTMTIFSIAFGLLTAVTLGGFALLFTELRRLDTKIDSGMKEMRNEWKDQRLELAEEFRAQRAEALALITATKR
jgi:GAF domain-containing protein